MKHQQGTPPRRVAVLHHPRKEITRQMADDICRWLKDHGIEALQGQSQEETTARELIRAVDMVIVLGGDGSMLRTARMAAGYNVSLIGLNMGRLGFLSEMTPKTWRDLLPRIAAGDYWLEQRMMLRARSYRAGKLLGEHLALNDVVVSRGSLARVVWLKTEIDGANLSRYVADGLIISTPTGSTAYALAAGGPVLPPELHNILVIPIAPHLTLNRAVVLAEGSVIKVYVGTDHQAILTVDGQYEFDLENDDQVEVSASEHASVFARLGDPAYFYRSLMSRLGMKEPDATG